MMKHEANDGSRALPLDPDLTYLIEQRARQDVDLLVHYYRQAGVELKPGCGGIHPSLVPSVAKLVAGLRLARWEQAGFIPHLKDQLPSSSDVFRELRESPEQHSLQSLPTLLLKIWLTHLAWEPLGDGVADVLVNGVNADDSLVEVAELLWQFRHLIGDGENV